MPLIQKVIQVGDSRAVTIPKSWLTYYERQSGQCIKEVSLEVNGTLIIRPIIENKSKSTGGGQRASPEIGDNVN
jgi:antitoxin component of MazEF toxin-antitoxin module